MDDTDDFDDDASPRAKEAMTGANGARTVDAMIEPGGVRLDKALTTALDPALALSRSRLRALIEAGQVSIDGAPATDPGAKARRGARATITIPAPTPATPAPEPIPLAIVYEDAHLVVVDKPAGMTVHPAPGNETGTLVNALLAHCGASLSGVGGEARPGVVHRIDKDTSGLLVVAKSDAAHQGLAAQFAKHDLERSYRAIAWDAPNRADARLAGLPSVAFEPGWIRIETELGRHRADRKKMSVVKSGGRRAVTRLRVVETFASSDARRKRPLAALLECRLETGRTHQIRVHLAHIGAPLVGDPVYGRPRRSTGDDEAADALAAFPRQALHAATLGFRHPITNETLRFEADPPADFQALTASLQAAVGRSS